VGQDIKLTASDGFKLGGYRADPAGAPKAAIVVIQEIFGVNHHIRSVCDRLASAGYVAIAPSIFDRIEPNFQCGYSPDEVANARRVILGIRVLPWRPSSQTLLYGGHSRQLCAAVARQEPAMPTRPFYPAALAQSRAAASSTEVFKPSNERAALHTLGAA